MTKTDGVPEVSQSECYDQQALGVVAPDGTVDLQEKAVEVPVAGRPLAHNSVPLMDLERDIVGWDAVDDPANPKNWNRKKRDFLMLQMATMATISPMASSLCAPGIESTMKDLHESSQVLGSLMITIYVLGYAIGPLFLAPLSEIYGRYPVVMISSWIFMAWLLGCSFAPDMPSLIVMRFLAGVGGSAIITISPAVVGDLYPVERRAFGSAIIVGSQSLGPIVGPICGGFITEYLSWRWSYWILVLCAGSTTAVITLFMQESNAVVLLERKVRKMRKTLGRSELVSAVQHRMSAHELLKVSLLLAKSPIVLFISIYVATAYALLYLMFTTLPTVFEDAYGWSLQLTGLSYLGRESSPCISLFALIKYNDAQVVKLMKKNNGVFEPEMRLATTTYCGIMLPMSLIWYGWVTDKRAHWSVVSAIVGTVPFGIGMLGLFLPLQTYMVDAFPLHAASAVAAPTIMRSLFAAFLPLAGPPLYQSLGLGWGNTLLGLLALAMIPIPMAWR
ncbi:uncharacterized protein Z520_01828 [Fonsecaea multimorphosa CBS 102226]|uniref:Major facilitator superfamily (MFS) profile domain-containing protein n=1 Tax=Fonsecaea multimorphosa CBS 102226 TaxID=1442371 RepID=A0A0D2KEC2_9EURO|nr:uncharacterized protein Z520_01828 [Fonsecaea multimorphosa CBS 102226]KIY01690.1 hypothetical protein Z520_01828 [Fonsecaea multimorphosa CBS 102226]